MLIKIFTEYWSEISLAISGVAAFFAGRKGRKTNDHSSELDNIVKVREIEKKLLIDMEEQINKLIKTNNELENIVAKQATLILCYKKRYGDLT
jgi:hypothetical protein